MLALETWGGPCCWINNTWGLVSVWFNVLSQLYAAVTMQKDRERAGRVVSTALWIGVIAGLAITASLLIYGQAALAATGEAVHHIHTMKLHIHGLGCSSHSLHVMRHYVLSCWIFHLDW
jgi:Na+-driven multidrug efflux pump